MMFAMERIRAQRAAIYEADQVFAFRGTRVSGSDCPPPDALKAELAHPFRGFGICHPDGNGTAFRSATAVPVEQWEEELRKISLSVPAFAVWQVNTLERCFQRYCSILQAAARDVRFRRNCVSLMANAERISERLGTVQRTLQWPAFNRAAFEIGQDCEQLAGILSAGR